MKKLRLGHIKILSALFEEDDYPFDWDGKRLRILTISPHVRPDPKTGKKYINIIDNLSTGYTKASICASETVASALKSNNPQVHKDFMIKLARSKDSKSKGGHFYVPFLKPDYDLEMVKKIIESIKADYRKKYPKKLTYQTSKKCVKGRVSALGRTLNKNSIKLSTRKGYTPDWWPFVQDEARVKAKMKCECCGLDFSTQTVFKCDVSQLSFPKCFPLYHVHHKDKNTMNNNPKNLEALCLTCHSFKGSPGDGHSKFRTGRLNHNGCFSVYESNILHHRILNQMRRRQGIDISFDFDFDTLERKVKLDVVQNVIEKQSFFQKILSNLRMSIYQVMTLIG